MPHFNVQIREENLDGKVEPKLIRALTEAVVTVYGEWARAVAVVELFGIPQHRWGIGGIPSEANAPIVTLNMREPALNLPGIGNAPARLIASVTDAMVAVFGEPVRQHVTALVVGVPAGRSGVAGEAV
jgi:phenylpyruvate tautomerase PptA (4-oxalocrotonate tautomerase family)